MVVPGGLGEALPARRRGAAGLIPIGLVGAVVAVVLVQHQLRRWEAHAAGWMFRSVGLLHTQTIGSALIFPDGHRWAGLNLTVECSSALLIAPFFLIAAGLLATRRVALRRTLVALAVVAVMVFFVNLARITVIAESMRAWGITTGYERSHVLIGSLISVFGVAVGLVIFLVALLHEDEARRRRQRPMAGSTSDRSASAGPKSDGSTERGPSTPR
ncbi:MAG: hypothetical protein ACYC1D_08065 [Acidimicrobiales bacterium]